jgi:transposase-like protein
MSHYRTAGQQNGTTPVVPPDSEVRPDGRRRTFTVEYKLRILAEADRSSESGAIGALLRREGLYSSHLTDWRRQRNAGELRSGVVKVRGRSQTRRPRNWPGYNVRMSDCVPNWSRQSSSSAPKKSWRRPWRTR